MKLTPRWPVQVSAVWFSGPKLGARRATGFPDGSVKLKAGRPRRASVVVS